MVVALRRMETETCTAVGSIETSEGAKLPLSEGLVGGFRQESSPPAQWSFQPTSTPIGASESALQSVWCESATGCRATGAYAGEGKTLALEEKL